VWCSSPMASRPRAARKAPFARRTARQSTPTCPLGPGPPRGRGSFAGDGVPDRARPPRPGHEEVRRHDGRGADRIVGRANEEDVDELRRTVSERGAYITQTTSRRRNDRDSHALAAAFPKIVASAHRCNICYATINRRAAVTESKLATCGRDRFAPKSSNSVSLVEVAARLRPESHLIGHRDRDPRGVVETAASVASPRGQPRRSTSSGLVAVIPRSRRRQRHFEFNVNSRGRSLHVAEEVRAARRRRGELSAAPPSLVRRDCRGRGQVSSRIRHAP